MKNHPIHENLDTSFVNVSALVRYLRRRQFVGSVRVELSGYEADIFLDEGNALRVREYDRITGRIGEGEEALQRILIRSREPGGIVNVYQPVAEEEVIAEKPAEKSFGQFAEKPVLKPEVSANLLQNIKPGQFLSAAAPREQIPTAAPLPEIKEIVAEKPKPKISLPNLPFEFSNKVEAKAKNTNLAPDEWQQLLSLTGELLGTIDKTLATANLDFSAAFLKARTEISDDYPFLDPGSNIFEYKEGKISMREQTSAKLFTASILEALRRMLEKLGENPKFAEIYRLTTRKILMLVHHRRTFYDKFSITKPLEKIVGI